MSLKSFEPPVNAVVIGASGGIGSALVNELQQNHAIDKVFAVSRRRSNAWEEDLPWFEIDLENEATIESAAAQIGKLVDALHLVIVATGVLSRNDQFKPEKSWKSLEAGVMAKVFELNTIGPALAVKHFVPLLPKNERAVIASLTARVGSISDNQLGGWYSYRASKAALNMIIRTLSIELERTHQKAICVGLHPGTVQTNLSRSFVKPHSSQKIFAPEEAAKNLLNVINTLKQDQTGRLWDWQGSEIHP